VDENGVIKIGEIKIVHTLN